MHHTCNPSISIPSIWGRFSSEQLLELHRTSPRVARPLFLHHGAYRLEIISAYSEKGSGPESIPKLVFTPQTRAWDV